MSREIHALEVILNDWTADAVALCHAHGEDPMHVAWAQYDVLDSPLVRFGIYLADENGHHHLACDHAAPRWSRDDDAADHVCTLATVTREHAAVGDLPSWLTDPSDEIRVV